MENLGHAWLSVNLDQETWAETDATAPSTTDGVLLLLGVPGLLEPVALEFRCCACWGIKIEFKEGFKDNSARQQKRHVTYWCRPKLFSQFPLQSLMNFWFFTIIVKTMQSLSRFLATLHIIIFLLFAPILCQKIHRFITIISHRLENEAYCSQLMLSLKHFI